MSRNVVLDDLEIDALEEVIRIRIEKLCNVDDMSEVVDKRIAMWNGILQKIGKEPNKC
jgi:hypothetical protein